MTDIHAHILPKLDDGPRELEQSIELVSSCASSGIDRIAATSHYYSAYTPLEEFTDRRSRRLELIRNALNDNNINVEIISAAEVNISNIIFNNKDISSLCYGNTNNILLEIPHTETEFENASKLIERIGIYFNVTPVVAHIERYKFLVKNEKNVEYLRSIGCFIQIDAECLLKGSVFLKRRILRYINNGLVDFIASDCHGADRPQNLQAAYEIVSKKIGDDCVRQLKDNANAVVSKNLY